ncbi:hypothetical protein ACFLQ0_03430, partial [Nitrospinota bacterium]
MAAGRKTRPTKVEHCGAREVVNPVLFGGGSLRAAAEKTKSIEILVDRLIDKERETVEGGEPAEVVFDLARRMLLSRAIEAVGDLPPGAMGDLSPEKLARMITQLEKSHLEGERLRIRYGIAYERAKEDILARLEEELRGHPELMKQVAALTEKATQKALA